MRANIIKYALVVVLVVGAYLLGGGAVAKYSLITEMQLYEELLIRNAGIFIVCKELGCNEEVQSLLVLENDRALDRYKVLERELKAGPVSRIGLGGGLLLIMLYDGADKLRSSEDLRGYYEEIGCGVDGVVC